jgi:thymidylate kinase
MIEIKITGYTGEGKTTIANIIAHSLMMNGFKVKLVDEPNFEFPLELIPDCIKSLIDKEKHDVKIETLSLRELPVNH